MMLNDDYRILDSDNMYDNIYRFPDQIKEAMEIGSKIQLKNDYSKIKNIVFAGMGGSAIGGDIISLFLFHSTTIPMTVTRNYYLPNWVDENTLVICFSYSGNTEETLSIFKDAVSRNAKIAGITSGGKIGDLLSENGADWVKIPSGYPPRASLGYLCVPVFYLLNRAGIISDVFIKGLNDTISHIEKLRDNFSREDNDNPAYDIASRIYSSIPVIYGEADSTATIALRWRGQLEENGKMLAFHHALPEMNHNEIVGWENNPELLKQMIVIWLIDKENHPRTKQRQLLTKEIIGDLVKEQIDVHSEGKSLFERVFYLIHLGDWISLWAALLHGVNPSPVHKIDRLKSELAK